MGTYRKKPVEVEAIQFDGSAASATEILEWILNSGSRSARYARYHSEDHTMVIDTPAGTMKAFPGDWIIRGVNGGHYLCTPNIFQATYDAVEV